MDLIKEIFAGEVFPAVGCTEPISCAYACAAASEQLNAPVEGIELTVDPGTFKNGAAVTIPNSQGQKGNVIAAAMGAMIAQSSLRLEILSAVTPEILKKAKRFVDEGHLTYRCKEDAKSLHVEVHVHGGGSRVHCIVSEGHTNISRLEKDGRSVIEVHHHAGRKTRGYRDRLRAMKLEEVLREVISLDDESRSYIQRGIDMNLAISEKGVDLKRNAYQLQQMMKQGLMADDLFYRVKQRVASAVDARMGGLAEPVMTSGGSGNQGVLTILLPYLVGRERSIELPRIQESIAVSHAVNSYIKCFTGELSVVCGCTIAAGIASATAIVYQTAGIDMEKITCAVHNIIADLSGIICDGAKPGCSMKIVTGADTAMRSAFMALAGYGISMEDGIVGCSAEQSIRNLGRISLEGMGLVDSTVVHILQGKCLRRGQA
ncbi:serine dehydratase subunit alpha family protein [Desulfoferrobacter suflitae]|uniref:L-cysteine desulfidase family protein n=1 Tax=Desulfoferrobacter suflitae TaxID=2865782 RepID=UPI0021649DC5|nr:L-serine ammonia-lyase, iron-sulfur-dependent, subunit alpha [Desulfoferrobacter suflitae]MCK8603744.1 L-serine ammonia-lyase, iron-sulfur-dependent, subunit alpha [Desulfoferrobacter suflitae]